MTEYKIEIGLAKLDKVLASLEQIAAKSHQEDRSNIDATIQRFKFSIELFWNQLKGILESKGRVQHSKNVLQEAFKWHLIDYEKEWLKMLQDRDLTSHTYDEKLADQIFQHIQTYIPVLRETFDKLLSKIAYI